VIAAILGLPTTAIGAAMLFLRLAPELRQAIVTLIDALQNDDEDAARAAYEAARRAAFVARQKR